MVTEWGKIMDYTLWNEYLNINEYRMSDYDKAIITIIESMENPNEFKRISNT